MTSLKITNGMRDVKRYDKFNKGYNRNISPFFYIISVIKLIIFSVVSSYIDSILYQ